MTESLHLRADTKLADILAAYPWVKARLPQIDEKFKLLNSPLGPVMLKTATIADMSKRSGIQENVLIERLRDLISSGK